MPTNQTLGLYIVSVWDPLPIPTRPGGFSGVCVLLFVGGLTNPEPTNPLVFVPPSPAKSKPTPDHGKKGRASGPGRRDKWPQHRPPYPTVVTWSATVAQPALRTVTVEPGHEPLVTPQGRDGEAGVRKVWSTRRE